MIRFDYLTGWGEIASNKDVLSFLNSVRDLLSCGVRFTRFNSNTLVDFAATICVGGQSLNSLPTLAKEFQLNQLLPLKNNLQAWNQLIFDLYAHDSLTKFLQLGHVEGAGVYHPQGRLYGGHLLISDGCIKLSVSLTTINVLFELEKDISLGLQSLLAIVSNNNGLAENLTDWILMLRPGMLYEEIFNGRNS